MIVKFRRSKPLCVDYIKNPSYASFFFAYVIIEN
jgi:hypothetical protein